MLINLLLVSLAFAASANASLPCFNENTTWSSADISSSVSNVGNASSCQDCCQHTPSICTHFTWMDQSASPFNLMCYLFSNPSTPIPCSNCVSGPSSCLCGAIYECQIEDNNLLDMINSVKTEEHCQYICAQTPPCQFYTYYTSPRLNQTCLLFSSCDQVNFSCEGCSSGPEDCTNISHLITSLSSSTTSLSSSTTSLSPSSKTSTSPTTSTTTGTFTTSHPTCNTPEPPAHGDWFCPPSEEVATCHLECHPGYVSTNRTIITCTHGMWSTTPDCTSAIALITGGSTSEDMVEIYGHGLHKQLPKLPYYRYGHSLHYTDSVILICGGDITKTSCLTLNESLEWRSHSSTISARSYHSSVSILGQLHLLGGESFPSTTEHLSPSTSSQWSRGPDLLEGTDYACAVKIDPQAFLVTGGHDNPASVVLYNVSDGTVARCEDLTKPRWGHGCVHVRQERSGMGQVLVAGGYDGKYLSHSEIYNINEGRWSSTGQLTSGRSGVRLVVLGEDIVALGGMGGGYLASVDKFNVTSGEWSATEEMMERREWHAVTGVPPGVMDIWFQPTPLINKLNHHFQPHSC